MFMNYKAIKFLVENIVKEALLENKSQDLQTQYPSVSDRIDQASTRIKLKYLSWYAKTISNQIDTGEELINLINQFDSLVSKGTLKGQEADINQYSWDTLLAIVKAKEGQVSKTSKKKEEKQNAKTIYRDDRFVIVQPLDMQSSCHYGSETQWCISATKSKNSWDDYLTDNFIFIIDRNMQNPYYKKVAVRFNKESAFVAYDVNDNVIESGKFFSLYPEFIYEILKNEFHLIVPKEKLEDKLVEQILVNVTNSPQSYNKLLEGVDEKYYQGSMVNSVVKKLIQRLPFELLYLTTVTLDRRPLSLTNILLERLKQEGRSKEELLTLVRNALAYYQDYFQGVENPLQEIINLTLGK